jgi:hypothetical protein
MPNITEDRYSILGTLLTQESPLTAAQLTELETGFEDGLDSTSEGHSPRTRIGQEVRRHLTDLKLMPPELETAEHAGIYRELIDRFRGKVDSALERRRNIGVIPSYPYYLDS